MSNETIVEEKQITQAEYQLVVQGEAQRLEGLCTEAVVVSNNLVIVDADSEALAADVKAKITSIKREIDVTDGKYADPVYKAWKTIKSYFNPLREMLDNAEENIKTKSKTYRLALIKRQEEEEKRLRREAEEKAKAKIMVKIEAGEDPSDVVVEPVYVPPPIPTKVQGVDGGKLQERKIFKWKVVDFAKVPDYLKMIDDKTLNAMARSKNTKEIPGIEWVEDFEMR